MQSAAFIFPNAYAEIKDTLMEIQCTSIVLNG